jgi:ATP-dependent DNA helicase DinG
MAQWSDIFDAEGPLAAAIPGFATRHEQIAMAEAVAHALRQRGRLIVEAGTGTGKTFAYLAPTLLSGRRVIVSTGTRTLQDQLYRRDLPAISAALGRPVRVALLKGRANYLCLHRLELAEQQAAARGLKREIAIGLSQVRAWSRVTREGDIAELAQLGEADPVWPWVTSTRDNCLGPECPSFDRCHVVQARREAQAADVVVVNHHLLMADLVLKDEGFGDLLPGADAIIIDEAHQLPEVATHFLGFSVSSRQLQSMARDLALELITSSAIVDLSASFAQTLERQLADLQDGFAGLRERVEFSDWPETVSEALESVMQSLGEITTSLTDVAAEHAGLAAVRRRALELSARLSQMLAASEKQTGSVRWAQVSAYGVSLHYVPLDIAERLGALIESHASAWICTSATLCVGEDFGHFTRRIGMTQPTTACFGSPFDYERQALLYLPTGLDAPSSSRHTRQVIDAVLPILDASGGRAFLLFTSHRALRDAAAILSQRLGATPPFTVLVQGEAPKEALLARFRECGNGVLLGTSTFWEGVDVKGFALSVVVIDKLPFAVPDDPVLKARLAAIEARGGNPFFEEQVPQAVISLKQGVGRLIRDPDDFGVVVLCDQRLRSRPYGRIFLDSLPPMPRTDRLDEVTHFLRTRLAAAGAPTPRPRAQAG